MLIESGTTYNFIDESLVTKRGFKENDFLRFNVIVGNKFTILYTKIM